jgi:3-hydroxyisobutyrate dehydrogenase-like beta-hydroxyacid dehydrogenase
MVRRLVETGHEVRALGRSVEKRREVSELGAQPVTDLADVGADADVVIVCVFADEQVQQVCLESAAVHDAAWRGACHPHDGKPTHGRERRRRSGFT